MAPAAGNAAPTSGLHTCQPSIPQASALTSLYTKPSLTRSLGQIVFTKCALRMVLSLLQPLRQILAIYGSVWLFIFLSL